MRKGRFLPVKTLLQYAVTMLVFALFFVAKGERAVAQTTGQPPVVPPKQDASAQIDSMRKLEENGADTVIFTAKFIRYTRLRFLNDSTYTVPIDTTVRNFQHYNASYRPYEPTVNLGNIGLAYRDMLFNPRKNIGFDAGFHSLDRYLVNQDSINYYRARTPFTQLYYINASQAEQVFNLIHSQNIKPNLNVGATYRRIGAEGFYEGQKSDHTNITVFSWFHSNNNRYNLLANVIFNTLKAGENGSVVNDSIFTVPSSVLGSSTATTRLSGTGADLPRQTWKQRDLFLKQFYYIGRIDSTAGDSSNAILPTQRVTHTLNYTTSSYRFFRNEEDTFGVFPNVATGIRTNDSTQVKRLMNEFTYSFYLRGKSLSFIKNEVKLDLGVRHELVNYSQMGLKSTFQSVTLMANAGYRFSNRVFLEADLQQLVQGRNAGDLLYEANASFLLSKSVGRIVLGAYQLHRTQEEIYRQVNYQFHKWDLNPDRSNTTNLSFSYENPKFAFRAKAEYFLLGNYTYLQETAAARQVYPVQASNSINLLKIYVAKNFSFRRFTLENYAVYQKTDFQEILRTPELYLYNSLYYTTRIFKTITAQFGVDSRFNSSFEAPSYAINISQFYNDNQPTTFSSYPVLDAWLKLSLRRANIFIKNNYINQGLLSKGYYTVNRYPMPNRQTLLFGVKWDFYN